MPGDRARGQPATVQTTHLPAPIGGINTVDAGSAMPATDCVFLYNMIPAEYGLRSRLGYREWCTNLEGASDSLVRSILSFAGARSSALFATTSQGIYAVSASGTSPSLVVTFPSSSGDAGYGVSCVCATPAGRFLLYCDEVNGLYVYTENTTSWAKVAAGTTETWEANTDYLVGDSVVNGTRVYECTVAGHSASSGGPTGTGGSITDGTVTWAYSSDAVSGVIGPSLADQQAGNSGDPADFVFVTVWKSRVWFVERDTSRGWYLDVNSIFGTATSFDFGSKMRAGGPLVGLFNWSYDGGSGLDTTLVGLSGAGDVVIYQGTDPSSSETFGLKGCWFVAGLPAGRRVATDYGGDVLVMSLQGVVPLSKLVIGNPVVDRTQYATAKISNLFSRLASSAQQVTGWSIHIHPTDNALLILVPSSEGTATTQLAMSFATRGWSQYRDLPMTCAGAWDGNLYFGTDDGRVWINTDYVDGVLLSDPNAFTPVAWSVLPAFQNGGNARQKQIKMMRPVLLAEESAPAITCAPRYNFDLTEPDAPALNTATGDNIWDSAIWDEGHWGGDYAPSVDVLGGYGMGRDVSVAIVGSARARTVLVGVDIIYEQGGLL